MLPIKPTKMNFNFEHVPKNWFHNDEFMTNFMVGLSVAFPAGERFFVDAVREFRHLADSELEKQNISGFIGQEAMHSLQHASLHRVISKYGTPAVEIETFVYVMLKLARKHLSKRQQLAVTVGLEHFTAILAKQLVENETLQSNLDDTMKPLWLWHAKEELEHKSVAFDVYMKTNFNYIERIGMMIASTIVLFFALHVFQIRLGIADGSILNVKQTLSGMRKLYGVNGYITKIIPEYLMYFKPSFSPSDIKDPDVSFISTVLNQ